MKNFFDFLIILIAGGFMRSLHFALLQSRWRVEGFTLLVAMTW